VVLRQPPILEDTLSFRRCVTTSLNFTYLHGSKHLYSLVLSNFVNIALGEFSARTSTAFSRSSFRTAIDLRKSFKEMPCGYESLVSNQKYVGNWFNFVIFKGAK